MRIIVSSFPSKNYILVIAVKTYEKTDSKFLWYYSVYYPVYYTDSFCKIFCH